MLAMSGVMLLNTPSHLAGIAASGGYNPGLVTSIVLFLPYGLWTLHVARREYGFAGKAITLTFVDAVIIYAVLFASMIGYMRGAIPATVLVAVQVANAALFAALPLVWDAVLGKRLTERSR